MEISFINCIVCVMIKVLRNYIYENKDILILI